MGNTTEVKFSIERRLEEMPTDSPDIFYVLKNSPIRQEQQVEIQAEIPAAIDTDIIIGQVFRWLDLQKLLGCDLRVYMWSSNTEVEKYVMSLVTNMEHLYVTPLPMYLKGDFEHDA